MSKTTKKNPKPISIAKKNKRFKAMTKPEQRVAIAKDVIAQIKLKRIKALPLTYLVTNPTDDSDIRGDQILCGVADDTELQSVFKEKITSCNCCAKGAIFLAAVERFNNLPINWKTRPFMHGGGYFSGELVTKHLGEYFSAEQLNMIEGAFEGFYLGHNRTTREKIYKYATKHGCDVLGDRDENFQYETAEDRLLAIMKNIVRNKGTFKV
jgi:hypothetical protein